MIDSLVRPARPAVPLDPSRRADHPVPDRGDRRGDGPLLGRALAAWSRPGRQTRAEPGTDTAPPTAPPQLLYAGTVDGTGVAVLYDGRRIARYTDGPGGDLDLGRADGADPTTAGAVVLHRRGTALRYLLAPWVDAAETRRIDQPDAAARPLEHPDGVTAATPGGGPHPRGRAAHPDRRPGRSAARQRQPDQSTALTLAANRAG
ncbi:hypothetical protein [Kitasatospora sp. NPDC017646]|uniref:hypothetical protein n=1 Tax=Kitasatospora sp. NPDC017646 TaxID=3364024 RepID=UPI00379F9433